MSVAETENSGSLLGEAKNIRRGSDIELVDMGHDLLTPTSAIIAYTEMLLEYAGKNVTWQDFIPDINKMLAASNQLSTLITQLFSKKSSPNGEIDLEAFTSAIRHDLRTPINAIIGYGEMLLEDVNEDNHPDACSDLQKLLTTARRLLTLIGDLSYFSKSESQQKKTLEPELAQANTLMDEVVHSIRTTTNPTIITEQQPVDFPHQTASLLVVDDKESNRDLLSRRLDRQGFHVEVAENGVQALQMIRKQDYDLVLLDIIMPEMNGYQVLAEIKNDPKLCRIPVIMISALDEITSVVNCIEMGAEDYLQKPFNQVILNAKISASLERKRLRDREYAFIKKLQVEQQKSEKLLLNILPKPIADRLKKGDRTIADSFPEATVLFSDLVGFTELSTGISALN
jgi:CheY-like chemotaxis protein